MRRDAGSRHSSRSAIRDDGQGSTFPLSRINKLYGNKYPVRERDIERAFFDVYENGALIQTLPVTPPLAGSLYVADEVSRVTERKSQRSARLG